MPIPAIPLPMQTDLEVLKGKVARAKSELDLLVQAEAEKDASTPRTTQQLDTAKTAHISTVTTILNDI